MLTVLLCMPWVTGCLCFCSRFVGCGYLVFLLGLTAVMVMLPAVMVLVDVVGGNVLVVDYGVWFSGAGLDVHWSFGMDAYAASMALLLVLVGCLVVVYSVGYVGSDPHCLTFVGCLHCFIGAMLLVVVSTNWVVIFLGWELLGVFSFGLIGFWSTRCQSGLSGNQAFILNRVGDTAFVIGLLGCVASFGSVSVGVCGVLIGVLSVPVWFLLGLTGAAMGKSGQLPLHFWLPNAMEGPTPVSALLHAATMVTAGVFLLVRLGIDSPMGGVVVLGCATVVIGGVYALSVADVKAIIAYSTLSQLGFFFVCVTVGSAVGCLGHVLSHGLFKALLFLGAGLAIHGSLDDQDVRAVVHTPVAVVAAVVGGYALCGLPFSVGFTSKDALCDVVFAVSGGAAFHGCLLVGCCLTGGYAMRLLMLVYGSVLKSPHSVAHWSPWCVAGVVGGGLLVIGTAWASVLVADLALCVEVSVGAHWSPLVCGCVGAGAVVLLPSTVGVGDPMGLIGGLEWCVLWVWQAVMGLLGLSDKGLAEVVLVPAGVSSARSFVGNLLSACVALVFPVVFVVAILLVVAMLTIVERQWLSAVQRRLGPSVVGVFGLLQAVADGVKLMTKQAFVPTAASPVPFLLGAAVTFVCPLVAFGFVPVLGAAGVDHEYTVLAVLVASSIGVYGIFLAAWGSNSKYALLGGCRSIAQVIAYEVSFGFLLVAIGCTVGSLSLVDWLCSSSLPFVAAPAVALLAVTVVAETNRHPFDLPEAESELVAGYNVEYASTPFVLFFLGEYAAIGLMSALLGVCVGSSVMGSVVVTLCMMVVYVLLRAAIPRLRMDQLLVLGWTVVCPLAFGCLFIAIVGCGCSLCADGLCDLTIPYEDNRVGCFVLIFVELNLIFGYFSAFIHEQLSTKKVRREGGSVERFLASLG